MEKIKIGDVVQLNSGSPNLTVTNVSDHGVANVCWIDGLEYKTAAFPIACFKKIS